MDPQEKQNQTASNGHASANLDHLADELISSAVKMTEEPPVKPAVGVAGYNSAEISGTNIPDQSVAFEKPKRSNTPIIVVAILLVLVLAASIIIAVIMINNHSNQSSTPEISPSYQVSYTILSCNRSLSAEELTNLGQPISGTTTVSIDYIDEEVQDIAKTITAKYETPEAAKDGARLAWNEYLEGYLALGLPTDPFSSYYSVDENILSVVRFANANQIKPDNAELLDLIKSRSGNVITSSDDLERNFTNSGYTCTIEDRDDETPSVKTPDSETIIKFDESTVGGGINADTAESSDN